MNSTIFNCVFDLYFILLKLLLLIFSKFLKSSVLYLKIWLNFNREPFPYLIAQIIFYRSSYLKIILLKFWICFLEWYFYWFDEYFYWLLLFWANNIQFSNSNPKLNTKRCFESTNMIQILAIVFLQLVSHTEVQELCIVTF